MKVLKIENSKPKYCISFELAGKTMNYLSLLYITTFIGFTIYVQFSRYIFMHNFVKESPWEMYAFQAVCICYSEFYSLKSYHSIQIMFFLCLQVKILYFSLLKFFELCLKSCQRCWLMFGGPMELPE